MFEHKQPLIWAALSAFIRLFRSVSRDRARAIGAGIGSFVALCSHKKAREAEKRCSEALGVGHSEACRIVKGAYRHFGSACAEFARLPQEVPDLDEIITVHGEENIKDALARGKGVMMVTAHIGNWEYAAAWMSQHGYPVNTLGTDQRDSRITELIKELRTAGGSHALGKATDLRCMIRALRANQLIAIPVDQDAKRAGILSPFLGKPASTPVGVAKIADKLGCAIVPGFCIRRGTECSYDYTVLPALEGHDGKRFGEDIQQSMDDCNRVISEWITKYPEQWMWMYPRWESVERGYFDEVRNRPWQA